MSKKNIKINYFYNMGYQILNIMAIFITTPYVSRVLGADGVGIVSYVESVIAYFLLFSELGFTVYGQREVAYVQDKRNQRSEVFWNIMCMKVFFSLVVFVIFLVFAGFQVNSRIYYLMSFLILASMIDLNWFYQGMEQFDKTFIRNILLKLCNILFIFIMIKNHNDILWYAFGISFFVFLSNLSLWVYLPQYINGIKTVKIQPFKHISIIIWLFLPEVANRVYTVLDKTMIGVITKDSFENGYYEQAMKISRLVLIFITAIGTVMMPKIGLLYKNHKKLEMYEMMYKAYRFVSFLGIPLCVGLIVIAPNVVPWFFGEGYDRVIDLIRITSFLVLAVGINNVTGIQYLIATEREKLYTITILIGAIANLGMNLILIPRYESMGAAIASVIAETIIASTQLYVVRKEISCKRILKQSINYIIAGLVMGAILWRISYNWSSSFIHSIIIAMLGIIMYGGLLWLLRDRFFINNMKEVYGKIFGKEV